MKRLYVILFALLVSGAACRAQDTVPAAHYPFRLDTAKIMLGDQTTLFIDRCDSYPSADELANSGIIVVRQSFDTATGTITARLTSFEAGEHWYKVGADSVLITVADVPNVDTTTAEIRDIADVMRQPLTFGEIKRLALGVLIFWVAVAAAILLFLRIKRRKPLISVPEVPPLPADQRALQALETLRCRQLWQQGKPKEYHTELTDILRAFLQEACAINSAEMTSDQTLEAFRSNPAYSPDVEARLTEILQTADMVKFAKSEPLPFRHDRSMTDAVAVVRLLSASAQPTETVPASEKETL